MLGTTMKRWLIGLTAALALTGAAQAQTAVGDWHGALSTAGGDLRLVVRIKPGAGGLEGVMISPDQGAAEVALGDIKLDGSTLAFTAPRIRGTYQGRWDAAAKDWAGTWTQGPTALPLTLLAAAGIGIAAPASAPPSGPAWSADPESQYLLDLQIRQRALVIGSNLRSWRRVAHRSSLTNASERRRA